MFEQLKKQLKEIVEITEQCPEQYREKCFSILLEHFLAFQEKTKVPVGESSNITGEDFSGEWNPTFSKFVKDHGLTKAVRNVFHIESGKCEIIVRDLKTKDKAPAQVRLALLIGIKHMAGEETANIPNEELRYLCSTHAMLDTANFASIIRKNKDLFLQVGKGRKKDWKLTKPGEDKAQELIKELAGVSEG
jgi:hypothetical protein